MATRLVFRSHYLYDIDSVNFALGIRRFDTSVYQRIHRLFPVRVTGRVATCCFTMPTRHWSRSVLPLAAGAIHDLRPRDNWLAAARLHSRPDLRFCRSPGFTNRGSHLRVEQFFPASPLLPVARLQWDAEVHCAAAAYAGLAAASVFLLLFLVR